MNTDVVVIGAGFAGLSAAAMLAESGKRVLVVDARPQLGGRATAFRDRVTGEMVDNGQHVLFGCYRETFAFLRRVGAEENVRVQPAMTVPYVDVRGRRSVLRCPPLPPPLHLLAGILDWDALPWRDRLRALRIASPIAVARRHPEDTARYSGNATVTEWLEQHGQRGRILEWLWEPLAVAALNQSPNEAAAGPFIRVLAALFGPDPRDASLALPVKPLHLMYAEPARAFIEAHGGEVRTNALARLTVNGSHGFSVDLRSGRVVTPLVILAVPWHALGALLTSVPPLLESIVEYATGTASKAIVTVNLWYDSPVMDEPFVGLPGRDMQWVFDKRFVFDEAGSHLSLVSSGADALARETDAAVIARAAAEIADALPRGRKASLLRATVVREKRATFSLAPGQPPRPGTRTPCRGLFLAGDWIDTGLPGTIESAVISGHRAAAAVLEEG